MEQQRIVIALGGNAIQIGNEATAKAQQEACFRTAQQLLQIIQAGHEIVVAHGNGPQVGNIMLQQEAAKTDKTPAMPFDTCGAMSQGEIGYWLQQAVGNVMRQADIQKTVASIISQSIVDPQDPAFTNPTKPVGPFYTEEEAKRIADETGYTFKEDAGRGWRRVVPSPIPQTIVEGNMLHHLVQSGFIVIAVGGGGIPVIQDEKGDLHGVEAVIDKDLGAEKLAELVDADILLILTAVERVAINFNQPNQQELSKVSTTEMQRLMEEGHFAPGSMLPKVKAAMSFAMSKPGRKAIITSLERAFDAIQGNAGTLVIHE